MPGSELKMPVRIKPFDHQQRAFEFVLWLFGMVDGKVHSNGAGLLMQMGTGKSLVGVAVAGWLYLHGYISRLLIVCPLSITGVWKEEFEKYADFPFSLAILSGTADKKRQKLAELLDNGLRVVIVNYESSWRLKDELLKKTCGDGPFVSVPLFMPVEKQGDRHKRSVSMTFLVTN